MRRNTLYISFIAALLVVFSACTKEEKYAPDPYAGGKAPLEIKFEDALPSPTKGREGTVMKFKVNGALPYADKLSFLVNGTEADIVEVTENSISVTLPANVSTGGTQLVVDGQIYPGPLCEILGKVEVDPSFNAGTGANGRIYTIKRLSNGAILLGGSFTDYNGASSSTEVNGLARIANNGSYVTGMEFGEGAKAGGVTSIHQLNGNEILIAGNITEFDENELINNITKIRSNGKLQTEEVEVLNLTSDPENSYLTVPTFNGGTNMPISKIFVHNNTVTAIGAFFSYYDHFYERSTINGILRGHLDVGGIVRMDLDGALDSTFNVDMSLPQPKAYEGFSGIIGDGVLQADGKIIVVGSFRRYNGQSITGNIIRLNQDGSIDQSFQSGSGADAAINTITETPDGKLIISGIFTRYDGKAAGGLARLNADGSIDQTFQPEPFSGGAPLYAKQLAMGKILVTGTFKKYGNIIREGLCVLNPDGTLAENYNNTGKLDGRVSDILEDTNSNGETTVIMVGEFKRFNGKSGVGNITRLVFRN